MIKHHKLVKYSMCTFKSLQANSCICICENNQQNQTNWKVWWASEKSSGVKKSNHAWLSILEPIKVSSGKLHMANTFTSANLK